MARHWKYSSKRLGLQVLQTAVKGTGGKVLRHSEVNDETDIGKRVRGKGHTILVRSDQPDLRKKVSDAVRRRQPRQHFPNTIEGRKNARAFIRRNLGGYRVFVQHLSRPRTAVKVHGRIFINPNGTVRIYLASPVSHVGFARWPHEISAKYDLAKPEKAGLIKQGLNRKASVACRKIARNIFEQMKAMDLTDISRTAFVIYKDKPGAPEFYDLLFIQGMKRPSSNVF